MVDLYLQNGAAIVMKNIMDNLPTKFMGVSLILELILSIWRSFIIDKYGRGFSHKIVGFSKISEFDIIVMGDGYFIDKYGGEISHKILKLLADFQIGYYSHGGSNSIVDK